MNSGDADRARERLKAAADRLATDAAMLATASAPAREAGLAARVADLRRAVVTAGRAGIPYELIAHDSHMDLETIERWITLDDLGPRHRPPEDGPRITRA
ncbi:hypothetical protein GCM10010430_77750 [Kitasatospora cystarginea]|uniref:Uncharacterized protein n=1 Tax=Kitasatospora cystarginea TaxID=58350 RepID=A0ABP5RXI9_9ACTN